MFFLGVKLKIAALPDGISFKQIIGVAILAGVGFTRSIFVANLAFMGNTMLIDSSKVGIILGSVVSGIVGYLILRWSGDRLDEGLPDASCSNREFLEQISEYYQRKGEIPTSYKLSRKNAFLETSNLSSAFQRIAQEPKSKLKNLDKIYELVELNHTLLSSLASLSTFIQPHETTEAPYMFKVATAKIDENLSLICKTLKGKVPDGHLRDNNGDEEFFEERLLKFRSEPRELSATTEAGVDPEPEPDHQEAHLVWEQLQWLFSLSISMLKLNSSMKWD